jgi:hypothetical protein
MCCRVLCKVTSSVLVLFQQWSLPTMKGTCHNHAALCDLCTTAWQAQTLLRHPVWDVRHLFMHVLGYWKVSAVWVLNSLNNKQTATQMGVCLEHLLWYETEGDKFLDHIVEGYKSWCLHCNPETIHMCQQRKHPSSTWLKKSHTIPCTSKVLLTLFISCCGPLLIDCLPTTSPSMPTAMVKPWSTWVQ